jgi:hypothetical protein
LSTVVFLLPELPAIEPSSRSECSPALRENIICREMESELMHLQFWLELRRETFSVCSILLVAILKLQKKIKARNYILEDVFLLASGILV